MESNLSLCVPRLSAFPNPPTPSFLVSHQVPKTLPPNHILIRVDRFGFSANNITYQALGEVPHFRYFDFHPSPKVDDVSPETHGLTPMWGFGDVLASSHPKIKVGERVYGYLTSSRYLLLPLSDSDVNNYAAYVPRPHLPADRRPYNQITRCASDPQYDSSPLLEDLTMLYRPLYWTSFWCEDWLYSSSYRNGASLIVISSASSKTAFCLAYRIQKRIARNEIPANVEIIGLTSKGNLGFTKALGLYHNVITYDDLNDSSFSSGRKAIYVDVSGNEKLNERMLSNYGSTFVAAIVLGMSSLPPGSRNNWVNHLALDMPKDSTGALTFETFFMVEWLATRRKQLSVSEIASMQLEAWRDLMREGRDWVKIKRVYGAEAVQKMYNEAVKGGLGPEQGYIWSLWDSAGIVPKL